VETLAERIARDGPVSELDAIGWAIRLAKRLEALHVLGVWHGSVSPACVIAAGQDRNARAYLADVQHTTPSPAYQSPERILGGDLSAADDVWALGATLYALLTGQSPFAGNNDAEVRQRILAASPAPLAVFDVGDDDLQHILDHAFAREMPRRTANISAFRRSLEEWHPDRGVANLPPLEDEDSTNDDDDGARTMLVHDPGGFLRQSIEAATAPSAARPPVAAPPLAARPPIAAPAVLRPIPVVNNDDDDGDTDDDVRTVMRTMPKDDLANIIARATAIAEANKAAEAPAPFPGGHPGGSPQAPAAAPAPPWGLPPPAPHAPPPRPGSGPDGAYAAKPPPRPHAPPAPMTAPMAAYGAGPGAPAQSGGLPPAFGGRPAPLPQIEDHDSGDDDIRTMMRTPEQMIQEEESHDAPRTMLLRDDDPWPPGAPPPAAGQPPPPAAGNGGQWPSGAGGPMPAPTMALPAHYEPASPGYPGGASPDGAPRAPAPPAPPAPSEPMVSGPQGTQKIPSGFAISPPLNQSPPAPPAPDLGFQPQMPYGPGAAGAPDMAPPPGMGMVPVNQQMTYPDGESSKKGLVAAALIALLIAAAATFAFLKLKGL
jgi:hypothetical protein